MKIERADDGDIGGLARLLWLMHVELRAAGEPDPDALSRFATELAEWWRAHGETHTAFVAREAGAVVGMAWIAVLPRAPRPDALRRVSGDVQSVFVLPEHRGHGTASALVRAAMRHAEERGATRTTVHASPRAVPVYERLGFATSPKLMQHESS